MSISTFGLARVIALAAINGCGMDAAMFDVEDVDSKNAPYDGVIVFAKDHDDRGMHIYLCDDEPGNEQWMIDPSDFANGEVDPMVLTPENLQYGLQWLVADAWLCTSDAGHQSITTDRDRLRVLRTCGTVEPLTREPGGTLTAYLDPTTGDLTCGPSDGTPPAPRFTVALYTVRS